MLSTENIHLAYPLHNIEEIRIGIVHTQWNARLVDMIYHDAISTLKHYNIQEKNIVSYQVPGAMEIGFASKLLTEKTNPPVSGILTLGVVIKGETPHFDYVAMSVTNAVTQLNLMYNIPFIFGVITANDYQQALERAGVKGKEYAVSLLNMIALIQNYSQ